MVASALSTKDKDIDAHSCGSGERESQLEPRHSVVYRIRSAAQWLAWIVIDRSAKLYGGSLESARQREGVPTQCSARHNLEALPGTQAVRLGYAELAGCLRSFGLSHASAYCCSWRNVVTG